MSKHAFQVVIEVPSDFEVNYDDDILSGRSLAKQILSERINYDEEYEALGRPDYSIWEEPMPIQPGDLVDRPAAPELDDREVVAVGRDWLTLDIMGKETKRLPKINYRTTVPADGSL